MDDLEAAKEAFLRSLATLDIEHRRRILREVAQLYCGTCGERREPGSLCLCGRR